MKDYVLAGIFIGISASIVSLYGMSAVFLITSFIIIIFSVRKNFGEVKKTAKKFIAGLSSMAAIFFLINIFLLTDIEILLKLVKFEQGDFVFSPSPFFFTFGSLKSATGWPFLLTGILGYVLLISQKDRKLNLFLAFSIIIPFIILSSFSPWYARRAIFLIPFFALFSAFFLDWIKNRAPFIGYSAIILVLVFTLFYSAAFTDIFARHDIRREAGIWINRSIPEGATVGLMQMPAPYRTPPFQFHKYNLVPVQRDKEKLELLKPEYFIVSEFETMNMDQKSIDEFFSSYTKFKEFKKTPSFAKINFRRTQLAAKDFCIPAPCITIYVRKNVER